MEQGINDFIKAKKKKKKIKKMIMFILFFLLLLFLFLAKAPIFKIKEVQYKNNKIIDVEELYKLYRPVGNNIFFINTKKAEDAIRKNPYVDSISFERNYPDKLIINVKEKNASYYVKEKSDYYILANDLSILEVRNKINGLKLIELENIKPENRDVGQRIIKKESSIESASVLAELLSRNTSKIVFTKADITKRNDMLLYYNNVKIMLGSEDELQKKVNYAINTLSGCNIKKGYINVKSGDSVHVMDEDNPVKESEEDKKEKETYDSIVNGQGSSEEYGD